MKPARGPVLHGQYWEETGIASKPGRQAETFTFYASVRVRICVDPERGCFRRQARAPVAGRDRVSFPTLRLRPGGPPGLTLLPSSQRVTMTMTVAFCSQIILQKSSTLSSLGPRRETTAS